MADSFWETIVTLILALLAALLCVGLGVCLLFPWGLSSSLSRPSIWSLVTGTEPQRQNNIFMRWSKLVKSCTNLSALHFIHFFFFFYTKKCSKISLFLSNFKRAVSQFQFWALLRALRLKRIRINSGQWEQEKKWERKRKEKRRTDTYQIYKEGRQEEDFSSQACFVS